MYTKPEVMPSNKTYFHLKTVEPGKGERDTRVTLRLIGSTADKCDSVAGSIGKTLKSDARTTGKPVVDRSKQLITIKVRPGNDEGVKQLITETLVSTDKFVPATPVR